MRLKEFIKRCLKKEKYDSESFVAYLKSKGVKVGNGVRFFDPTNTVIDLQNPHMLKIGDNVRITKGCTILTHDYSWSVLAGKYGEILGGIGSVEIGNNVFVGMNTIILKNTIIGNNVIIGAGSVVSGCIESDSVYAGVPCRRIMGLNEYYEKRKAKQQEEYSYILEKLGNDATEVEKRYATKEYFWLFAEKQKGLDKEYEQLIERTGYKDFVLKKWYS